MAQDPTVGSTSSSQPPEVAAPPAVIYLEMTKCSAKWHDTTKTSVDLTADGYIRTEYRDARLTSQGWQTIQANGDMAPKFALVIYVEEAASPNRGTVPRTFYTVNNIVAPPALSDPNNMSPEVVLCALEPGPDVNTPPVLLGQMRRTRLRV